MKSILLKSLSLRNSKVFENYFFMTLLNVIGSLVGIIVYPYLIRVLGAENYGTYVFVSSVCSYFFILISFGFYMPALKAIVQNRDNHELKSRVVSCVLTAKSLLFLVVGGIFLLLLFTVPFFAQYQLLYMICFAQIIADILLPGWYFQGMQIMKVITYVQAIGRILTIPAVFLLVKQASDLWIYATIVSLSLILGAWVCLVYLQIKEGIRLSLVPFRELRAYFRDGFPFALSSSVGKIKQESVTLIIGLFFGMKDVAIYDLANKIVMIPRVLTMNINNALFPKIAHEMNADLTKKVIRYNLYVSVSIMALIAGLGYWAVLFLGGKELIGAYPLAIIVSSSVLVWLIVGSYIDFVFTPNGKYYFVTQNQIVALVSFAFFCVAGLLLLKSIYVVVIALALSGFCEIVYCKYMIKKHCLLP